MQPEVFKKDTKGLKIRIGIALLAIALVMGVLAWKVPVLRLSWVGEESLALATKYERSEFVRFDMEIYDTVVENYWQKVDEAELAELFRLSLSKALGGTEATLATKDRTGVAVMLSEAFKHLPEDKRRGAAVDTGIIVLSNLYPQGRSGLLSEKQETEFRDNVGNINRDSDLYTSLGLAQGASIEEVEEAIKDRQGDEQAEYAYSVLRDANTKAIYDETKMEPSVASRQTTNNSLYLDLRNITPATFQEVVGKMEGIKEDSKPAGIIVDLRGNVGGALDFARFFFALFVGPNQYAYDLFKQGELVVERTPAIAKLAVLDGIEDVAILTDERTQSTAELMTAIFKRFNRAQVVGTTTLGWGTVENTFPLETNFGDSEKYSVLLVHSLTLRDDGEAIETRGVDPHVDISSPGWQTKVSTLFKSKGFFKDVIQILEADK